MIDLINLTDKAALNEIKRYGSPPLELYNISKIQSQRLAKKYKADLTICMLGAILADFKLGLAIKEGKIKEHVVMSAGGAKELLEKEKVNNKTIDNVIHCVLSHHGTIPFKTKEAEIVANADCYRFLTLRGVFAFIENLAKENRYDLNGIIDYVELKADEKWNILTLQDVKEELTPNYQLIKRLAIEAKIV